MYICPTCTCKCKCDLFSVLVSSYMYMYIHVFTIQVSVAVLHFTVRVPIHHGLVPRLVRGYRDDALVIRPELTDDEVVDRRVRLVPGVMVTVKLSLEVD